MKKVIITGATGALGKEVSAAFAAADFEVVAVGGHAHEPDKTKSNVESYQVDLTSETAVDSLCNDIFSKHTNFDVAIFLAGGFEMGDFEKTGQNEISAMLSLNFETAYHISRKIFLKMKQEGGGRMIFMGARPAIDSQAGTNSIAYALSKSLVVKLSELFNAAGRKNGIISHVMIPSIMDTAANRKSIPAADFSKWVKPLDVAKTILFFCSGSGSIIREGVVKVYGDS